MKTLIKLFYFLLGIATGATATYFWVLSVFDKEVERYDAEAKERDRQRKIRLEQRILGQQIHVELGKVYTQQAPAMTGKTLRAEAWRELDPHVRRVVDGDRSLAQEYADRGFAVILNLLPGM